MSKSAVAGPKSRRSAALEAGTAGRMWGPTRVDLNPRERKDTVLTTDIAPGEGVRPYDRGRDGVRERAG
jgi:hypothetical protein